MDYFHQSLIEIAQDLRTLHDEFEAFDDDDSDDLDNSDNLTAPTTNLKYCDENDHHDEDVDESEDYDSSNSGNSSNSNSSDISSIESLSTARKRKWDDDFYRPEDVHSLLSCHYSHYYESQQVAYLQQWQRKFQPMNDQVKHDL
jgi:hypothetical protein